VQEAQKSPGTAAQGPLGEPRSRLGTAVVAVIALVGIIAGAIIFTRDTGAPDAPPTNNTGAPATLTDEEAIDRYLELEQLGLQAYRTRDLGLLSHIFTPDGESYRRAADEIRRLRRQDIRMFPEFTTQQLMVVSNGGTRIRLRQVVIFDARFENEKGEDITEPKPAHRQVVDIRLKLVGESWLIDDSIVVESRPVRGGNS
jgi:hypothetical protein